MPTRLGDIVEGLPLSLLLVLGQLHPGTQKEQVFEIPGASETGIDIL